MSGELKLYMALCADGELYRVGMWPSIEDADQAAMEMGFDVIWLFDSESAKAWLEFLTDMSGEWQ